MKKLFRVFLKSNKGSSLVTVIIVMMVIGILGSTLLFSAYTGTIVTSSIAKGTQNFYDAESLMDMAKIGMAEVVSEAAQNAFNDSLIGFNRIKNSGANFTTVYNEKFFEYVYDAKMPTYNSSGVMEMKSLFITEFAGGSGNEICSYSVETIREYLRYISGNLSREDFNKQYEITFTSGAIDDKKKAEAISDIITLEDFSIKHTNPNNGFVSSVIVDMVIQPPEAKFSGSEYSITNIPEFSLVVNGTFKPSLSMTMDGNMFVERINSSNGGVTLEFNNSMVICSDEIKVSNGSEVVFDKYSDIWAGNILVDGGTLKTNGVFRVQNDINIKDKSKVILDGRYIGFGSNGSDSSKSSAILINGLNNDIDMSRLDELTLAGQAFIKNEVATGESISVQSNQTAYLVPVEYLVGVKKGKKPASNPVGISSSNPFKVKIDTSTTIFEIEGVEKSYRDYGINKNDIYSIIIPTSATTSVQYFFLKFDTVAKASAYFRDFFSVNSDAMNRYLQLYLDDFTAIKLSNLISKGVGLTRVGAVYTPTDTVNSNPLPGATLMGDDFYNLTKTLSTVASDYTLNPNNGSGQPDNITPDKYKVYNTVVNEEIIEKIPSNFYVNGVCEFKSSSGEVVALLIKSSNFIFDSTTYPNVSAILTAPGMSNTLTINGEYSGIIITDGDVNCNANITADSSLANGAFLSICEDPSDTVADIGFASCLDIGIEIKGSGEDINTMWNVDDIVRFENWKER